MIALPTSFHLPEVVTRLPHGCHRDCADLDARSAEFARPYLRAYFGDADRTERYLQQRIPHYGCLAYPDTVGDRTFDLVNLMMGVTIYDDTFSKPGIRADRAATARLHERWCQVFDDDRPPEGPAHRFVHDVMAAAAARMTPHLARRSRQAWRDMADSHLAEAVRRQDGVTLDPDRYMSERLTNVYGWWITTHVEYALGIDLGELADAPEIRTVRARAIAHIALVNDLYSFAKELDLEEAMNLILVLLHRDGLTLQHAVDTLVELIHRAEADFVAARDAVRAGPLGSRADIRAYLDGIAYTMTGNLRWSQLSTRYHGDQHDGSLVTGGTISLTPRPTIYSPSRAGRVDR
ncbi:Terpene synthase family, metal binding domain [Nocardia otitidiscaviarum]|uniref:Terpene synthase n=1 Tax=Nocardia otitidiscaviarum TaxID=1823 RepID=A0A379JIQ7_9NOCA|nr:terpene synthase family protein [Nocardia otitidiscaviarum]SUD48398.1 Terpene synthase family, metal binding domain [Nocardia otitidiscaviarum]